MFTKAFVTTGGFCFKGKPFNIVLVTGAALNPDFAVEIVARVSNTKQISVSGYFLDERIVYYFEFKKCSERLSCEGFESRSRF